MEPVTQQKPDPLHPQHAADAWARYRRLMLWMFGAAIAAVIGAIIYLKGQGGPFPIHMFIATVLGVGASVMLAAALMGLVFMSSGSGHDDDAAASPKREK